MKVLFEKVNLAGWVGKARAIVQSGVVQLKPGHPRHLPGHVVMQAMVHTLKDPHCGVM